MNSSISAIPTKSNKLSYGPLLEHMDMRPEQQMLSPEDRIGGDSARCPGREKEMGEGLHATNGVGLGTSIINWLEEGWCITKAGVYMSTHHTFEELFLTVQKLTISNQNANHRSIRIHDLSFNPTKTMTFLSSELPCYTQCFIMRELTPHPGTLVRHVGIPHTSLFDLVDGGHDIGKPSHVILAQQATTPRDPLGEHSKSTNKYNKSTQWTSSKQNSEHLQNTTHYSFCSSCKKKKHTNVPRTSCCLD